MIGVGVLGGRGRAGIGDEVAGAVQEGHGRVSARVVVGRGGVNERVVVVVVFVFVVVVGRVTAELARGEPIVDHHFVRALAAVY